MLVRSSVLLCTLLALSSTASAQNATVRKAAKPATGRYIVVLNSNEDADAVAVEVAAFHRGRLRHIFRSATKGFALEVSDAAARALANDARVRYVEQDSLVSVTDVQNGAVWGLDRLDQRALPLDQAYASPASSGVTVNVHVIDTGIRTTHVEFGGRAFIAGDYVDDDGDGDPNDVANDDASPEPDGADCNGHGTHVAGTIGGETFGVAKNVTLWAHRVLNCAGNGYTSSVIAAVDAVTASPKRPSVVNMSLGGGASLALDEAVRRSISAGVVYVVAAGNDNVDAANASPARVSEAITVGATSSDDARASYSNYGSVLDVFAPGTAIRSAWFSNDTAIADLSGTSMATPHTAGVAALYLQSNPNAAPKTVHDAIVAAATPGVVTNAGAGSPTLLLYSGFLLPQNTTLLPPVISLVSAAPVSASSVSVTWTTDKPATSQVGYGIAAADALSPLNSTLTTAHTVSLTGLSASTTYRYYVRSADAQGALAASAEFTFTTPSASSSVVPVSGLTGHWRFEEGAGLSALDGSSTGNTGTISGATYTTGKVGGALAFSGATQYVSAAGNNSNTFTTAAWLKTAGTVTTWSGVVEYSTSSGLRRGIALDPTGKPVVTYGAGSFKVGTGGRLDDGAWHHLAATYDGTSVIVYVDGQPVTLSAATSAAAAAGSKLRIGDLAFSGYYFRGTLDEVRLYDRALSAAEVAAVYSDAGSTSPVDNQAPSAPTAVTAAAISSTQINLSWTSSTDNVAVTGYTVYRNGVRLGTTTAVQYADTGLAASTTYTYAVAAVDAAGNSSVQSAAVSATTPAPADTTAPVISAVSISSVTTSSAVISWTTSEPADTQAVYGTTTSYGSSSPLDGVLLTAHSVTLSGLAAGTSYHVQARSADSSRNAAASADLTFTTQTAVGSGPSTTGLIGYWSFDGITGSTAVDASPGANHGAITGATSSAGKVGSGALSFTGASQYVSAAGNNNTTFTASAWIKTAATVSTWTGVVEYSTSSGARRGIALDPGGRPTITYGAGQFKVSTGKRVDDGAWHHVAVTYDGTMAVLYVDGQLVTLGASATAGTAGGSKLRIGDLAVNGYFFKGTIDEVRLYDRALSAGEIAALQ